MTCAICFKDLVLIDNYILVCEKCGQVASLTHYIDESMINPLGYTNTCYKCIIHFKKYLKCLQDKSKSYVSDDILQLIRLEIENNDILTPRDVLHKNKLFSYYIHLPQIENRLFGKKPMKISYENEDKLIKLFNIVEKQIRKFNATRKRKQILRYKPILKRLLSHIGLHNLANEIPDLKSKKAREFFNAYWSNISLD